MTEDVTAIRRLFRDIPMCRVATVRPDGGPHVAPRWFVWLEDAIWVATRVGDTTWEDTLRDPRVSVVIDRGRDWVELTALLTHTLGHELVIELGERLPVVERHC